VLAVLVILEGTRRVIGWALPITAMVFLIHAFFFTRVTPDVLMEQLYLSTEGIFGRARCRWCRRRCSALSPAAPWPM